MHKTGSVRFVSHSLQGEEFEDFTERFRHGIDVFKWNRRKLFKARKQVRIYSDDDGHSLKWCGVDGRITSKYCPIETCEINLLDAERGSNHYRFILDFGNLSVSFQALTENDFYIIVNGLQTIKDYLNSGIDNPLSYRGSTL